MDVIAPTEHANPNQLFRSCTAAQSIIHTFQKLSTLIQLKMNRILILIISLFYLSACGNKQTTSEEGTKELGASNIVRLDTAQLNNIELSIVGVKEKNISQVFKVNGIIDVPPQNLVSVCMPMGGYLKHTKLLPGMHFNKGEVIALMEDAKYIDLQQEFLVAKSKLEMFTKEYEKQRN